MVFLWLFLQGFHENNTFKRCKLDGSYSDEITLRVISNIFNIEIIIASTSGQGGRVEIVPENTNPFARITLGYFA